MQNKETYNGDGKRKESKKTVKRTKEDAWERAEFKRIRQRLAGASAQEAEEQFINIEDWRD